MIVVADASPIICLSRIGRLDLLREVFTEILVPDEVRDEVEAGLDGAAILRSHSWIESRPVHDRNRLVALAKEMDIGESAAIVLSIEPRAERLLMDERRGRAVAEREGLTVIGVAGVLLREKALGIVPRIGPILDDLVSRARLRLAPEVVTRALALADEEP